MAIALRRMEHDSKEEAQHNLLKIQNKEAAATFCDSWNHFLWHARSVSRRIALSMQIVNGLNKNLN